MVNKAKYNKTKMSFWKSSNDAFECFVIVL